MLFALWLSGCDEGGPNPIRMTGWISTPLEETLTHTLIEAFEKQHPGRPVHYEPITANYMDKLLLMLGTRTAPDIIMLEAFWIPALIAYDRLLPLDDFIAQDPEFALEDVEPTLNNPSCYLCCLCDVDKTEGIHEGFS